MLIHELLTETKVTAAQVAEMGQLWASGVSLRSIGLQFKITAPTVMYHVKRLPNFQELRDQHMANSAAPTSGFSKNITDDQRRQMGELWASGMTLYSIGQRFGIASSGVANNLKQLPNYRELRDQHLANSSNPNAGISKNITDDQRREMGELWASGMTSKTIGQRFGITFQGVDYNLQQLDNYQELRDQHLANSSNPTVGISKNFTDDQKRQMGELWASGMATKTISQRFGIAHSGVFYHLKRLPNFQELRDRRRQLINKIKYQR